MSGVLLLLRNPVIACIDCKRCEVEFYDLDPKSPQYGQPRRKHNGTDDIRPRDHSCPPPCRTRMGCPNGTPEQPKRLTPQNERAYEHYQECRAVGHFPDDDIVRQNASIIRTCEDLVEKSEDREFQKLLFQAVLTR